jgi:hypothetical protein
MGFLVISAKTHSTGITREARVGGKLRYPRETRHHLSSSKLRDVPTAGTNKPLVYVPTDLSLDFSRADFPTMGGCGRLHSMRNIRLSIPRCRARLCVTRMQ